jgi:carboxypeptidase T
MKKPHLALPFFVFFVFSAANAQEKFSKVKLFPPANIEQRNELLGILEIDHFFPDGDGIVSEISSAAVKLLKKSGIRYEILVDDVAEDFRKNNSVADFYKGESNEQNRMIFETPCASVNTIIKTPLAFTAGSMGGYYTYTEMNTKMDALVAAYPLIVSKFSIGNSYQGRPIWCIKISDNATTDESGEPEVLYQGLQHAREAIGGTSLIFFMQYLGENYGLDSRVTDLVNTRELFIIPCLNPDGYEYNRTTNPSGGGLWRKNRRVNSGGSVGVDLNRNWSVDWANCAGATSSCGSASQSSDTYWGTSPFSEPETNALKSFITSRNFILGIDQHCYGPYYSLPFGRPNLHTMSPVDQTFYYYTAALMGKYNCHRAGNSPQTVGYEVAGGMKDWMLLGDIGTGTKGKVYGLTGEAGGGGFWAPSSSIIPLSKGLCFQNLQAAYIAGSYFDVQDQTDIAISSVTGNFTGLVRRVGAGNEPVTISIEPIENIFQAGSPVTINSFANYNDTYTASFSYTLSPFILSGQRIKFAWKIETGGYAYFDTVTKFYNPTSLLVDNMEGSFSTNWTATNSPTTSNGWNFTTNGAYQGFRSMAESPSGNYTASSTRRVTYRNSLNLSNATAAYLSFWVKHRAENCKDKLRIQISTNGGITYSSVCGINTISENDGTLSGLPALTGIRENWTRELVNLSAFKGFSNVRLRFEFTSNTDASSDDFYKKVDDGFYIDNLRVIKTTALLSGRSAPIVHLTGEVMENRDGYLNWEAIAESDDDYFVVEKSTNGQTFTPIGTVRGFPPYQFTDEQLETGNNLYRVIQFRTNGSPVHSGQLTLVKTAGALNMVIYPNPVNDLLNVQLNNFKAQTILLQVTDVFGRTVYSRSLNLREGNSSLALDTDKWGAQVYILRVLNAKKELLSLQKFVKQ